MYFCCLILITVKGSEAFCKIYYASSSIMLEDFRVMFRKFQHLGVFQQSSSSLVISSHD